MSDPTLQALEKVLHTSDLLPDVRQSDSRLKDLVALAAGHQPDNITLALFNPAVSAGQLPVTCLRVVMNNMPFIVDAILAELQRQHLEVRRIIHPNIHVQFTANAIAPTQDSNTGIDTVFLQIDFDLLEEPQHSALEKRLRLLLADITAIARDQVKMRQQLAGLAETLCADGDSNEVGQFLEWCSPGRFQLLGLRHYDFKRAGNLSRLEISPNESLGLLADESISMVEEDVLFSPEGSRILQQFMAENRHILINKTRYRMTVSGSNQYDRLEVRQYNAKGELGRVTVFVGLFTMGAHSTNVFNIPYIRARAQYVVEQSKVQVNSYNYRFLHDILNSYPRDELFCEGRDELFGNANRILSFRAQAKTLLFVHHDYYGKGISCVIYTPREGYQPTSRTLLTAMLEKAFQAKMQSVSVRNDLSPYVRLRIALSPLPLQSFATPDHAVMEQQCQDICRSWNQKLADVLRRSDNPELLHTLETSFAHAFSASFQESHAPESAIEDIIAIQKLVKSAAPVVLAFTKQVGKYNNSAYHLSFYHEGAPLAPSKLLRIVENLGLVPISDNHFTCHVTVDGTPREIHIHDFPLQMDDVQWAKLYPRQDIFEEAVQGIWQGIASGDRLNELLFLAEMRLPEVVLVRTIGRYLMQARLPYSQDYLAEILVHHAPVLRQMVDYFHARFCPQHHDADRAKALLQSCQEYIAGIKSLDEDRVLRRMLNVMQAVVRTNYYQRDVDGKHKPQLSLKIRSAEVSDLPRPLPLFETFVYAHRVEGIHLRSSRISRGGIRWSDRREDFRDEVLDLMKAQTVKNSVIVPAGAKGGFYVKYPPVGGDRKAIQQEAIACYQIFIRGLLDITDNWVDKTLIKPQDTICYDDNDPYLVVAADKGTASFSDIANAISSEYGHWLGDAFASGGSAGYDHKEMGITARGAWESVRHHGFHLGINVDSDVITAVGVGDMGGDVFGNGLLQSKHVKLLGAFSYSHIICDPNPDPAASYAERKRLFDNLGNWDQYNTQLLSKGGRIYSRADKQLELTPEIQACFDIEKAMITPGELMRAILCAQVDLLWFGGIGTYVKSELENDADVRDKANDFIRVNGNALRCRMIGEGANLGMTQRGRIEAARHGVALNADFIDNSAGVNTSDYEVNLKILLNSLMATNQLTLADRNQLLHTMTHDVAELVLQNNRAQNVAIGIARDLSLDRAEHFGHLIQELENQGDLDRKLEALPSKTEIKQLIVDRKGLTRPEISVVLSHTKLLITKVLAQDSVVSDPALLPLLADYFPKQIMQRFTDAANDHPLKSELLAMMLANRMVNYLSLYMPKWLNDRTGLGYADIARAYVICSRLYGLEKLWGNVLAAKDLSAAAQQELLIELLQHMDRTLPWFLNQSELLRDMDGTVVRYQPYFDALLQKIMAILPPERRAARDMHEQRLLQLGVSPAKASVHANLRSLAAAPGVVTMALETNLPIEKVAITYFTVGERFGFDGLREKARQGLRSEYWERQAISALIEDFSAHQLRMTRFIIDSGQDLFSWMSGESMMVSRLDALMMELREEPTATVTQLTVANRRLRGLVPSRVE